jgi:hypothetical protein
MRRLAAVLRGALRVILDVLRVRAGVGLLSAERGKLATRLTQASEEAAELRSFPSFLISCSFFCHGGLAGKDELRDVGESDGVTAGDALAGELPDEIAEEEIHFIGGGETVDVGKKLGGKDLGIDDGNGGAETVRVVGAKRWAVRAVCWAKVIVDQHVAALAAGVLELALVFGVLF